MQEFELRVEEDTLISVGGYELIVMQGDEGDEGTDLAANGSDEGEGRWVKKVAWFCWKF